MMKRCIVFIASLFFLCGGANGADRTPRLALVIGNSDYRDVVALPNPANDAKAMDEFLRKAGFEVTPANNLSQTEMRGALRDFADKIAAAGPETVALVYYAGHGVQIDGENFLVPVDAHIKRESDVAVSAVRLTDVMNILASVPAKTRIAIFDACRNNPFEAVDKKIGRGLAIVDAPKGSLVSYSTAPGMTALDGDGDHSPFTAALIDVGRAPGQAVEQTFKQVRRVVAKATDGQQVPWESSSLVSDFAFVPGEGGDAKAAEEPKLAEMKQGAPERGTEATTVAAWKKKLIDVSAERAYDMVIEANVVEAYEAFLTIYPKFEYATRIRTLVDRRLEMVAWFEAVTVNDALAYESFLVRYPDSDLAFTAERLLERAKNRSLTASSMASANSGAVPTADKSAKSGATNIVTKIVEKPVVKVVEKVVYVPGSCDGPGPRRLLRVNEGKMHGSVMHPVQQNPTKMSGMSMGMSRRR